MHKKTKIGFLRYFIDTKHQNFIYEEADNLKRFEPIFFYKEVRCLNRPLKGFHLEQFKINSNIFYFPKETIQLFKNFIKKQNLKILHAQFLLDIGEFRSLINEVNLPLLANYRGYELSNLTVKSFLPSLFPRLAKIITKSKFQKDELVKLGYDRSKIEVIYGGVNCKRIPFRQRELRTKNTRILSAARFVEKKGFETTLNFFKEVLRQKHGAKLTLIGDGENEELVKATIKRLSLQDSVQLMSFMEHTDFIYQLYKHDIFVLPSKTSKNGDIEGIPNVLKEAMASGMPVISTYHSGIPELIEDKKSGFLVEEKDHRGMLNRFDWILKNRKRTIEICRNARSHVENEFDIEKSVSKLELLYDKILKGARPH